MRTRVWMASLLLVFAGGLLVWRRGDSAEPSCASLEQETSELARAVSAAERALQVTSAQYQTGRTSYLQVIVSQAVVLADQRATINLLTRRLAASVSWIQALGGGWVETNLDAVRDHPYS
jgi:outer membrane protein TolC